MTNQKHTPGPWSLGQGSNTARNHAVCAGPHILANVLGGGYPVGKGWSAQTEANARLIAAAPDLLAAAKFISLCIANVRDEGEEIPEWIDLAEDRLHTAIAKAEGRS